MMTREERSALRDPVAYDEGLAEAAGLEPRRLAARIGHYSRRIMARLRDPAYVMEADPDYWRREAVADESARRRKEGSRPAPRPGGGAE